MISESAYIEHCGSLGWHSPGRTTWYTEIGFNLCSAGVTQTDLTIE